MTRTCYAAPLGGCSGGLTREHYISRSVLVAMGSGPTWIEGAQTLPDNSYPADALSVLLEQVATSATSWRILHRLGLAERQEEIADLESRAQAHSNPSARHDPGTVTDGRLRPPDADTCFPGATAPDIQARLERQSILYEAAKRFDFIITEAALRWSPPGVNLNAQLSYVSSMQTLPDVSIRMLPTGASSPRCCIRLSSGTWRRMRPWSAWRPTAPSCGSGKPPTSSATGLYGCSLLRLPRR